MMFDNGKMIILSKEEYARADEALRSVYKPVTPTGVPYLRTIIPDGNARNWFCEPLNPAEWVGSPDVYAYLLSRSRQNPE
jgi:hypothetical protein